MKSRDLICFFILAFISFKSFAQNYDSLVVENAQWQIIQDWDYPSIPDEKSGWLLRGDEVINGYTYKRLYYRTYAYVWSNVVNEEEFYGYLREDVSNKKVYALEAHAFACPETEEEYLLYDFSQQIGDTSTMCIMSWNFWPAVLEEIYQGILYGKERKLYHYHDEQFDLIEGIGHEGGLMEATDNFFGSSYHVYLHDYCRGTDEECGVVYVKVEENSLKNSFSIYPNPSSDIIKIIFYDEFQNSGNRKIRINDIYGKPVLEIDNPENNLFVDVSDLKPGLYAVTVTIDGINKTIKKLVISR